MGTPKGPIPFNQPEVDALRAEHAKGYIVGLGKVTGILDRKDIDVLLHDDPATFNLFVQALHDIQTQDTFVKSPMGYLQLAGIHDIPFNNGRVWNNTVKAKGEWGGYCRHSTVMFPTWHRPYLAAMEQSLYLRMVQVAQSYTDAKDKSIYLDAVQKFRLPYWDYYRPRDFDSNFPGVVKNREDTNFPYKFGIPQIFTVSEVMVRKAPSNEWKSMPNPLKSFAFPTTNGLTDEEWGTRYDQSYRTETWRYTGSKDPKRFEEAMKEMDDAIQKARAGNLTNIQHMLVYPDQDGTAYSEYKNFATNRQIGASKHNYSSLEGIHNNVHVYTGGTGHMSISVSAFDPVFWMHHANIDRWLAVWESINKAKLASLSQGGEVLVPFLKTANTYWKSSDTHDTENLGYNYPDIDKQNPAVTKQKFNQLEAWSVPDQPTFTQFQNWIPPDAPKERQPLDLSDAWVYSDAKIGYRKLSSPSQKKGLSGKFAVSHRQAASAFSAAGFSPEESAPGLHQVHMGVPAPSTATTKVWQWYVDMEVERMALNGPFGIYYFIGPAGGRVDVLPNKYLVAPTLAAFSYNFTSSVDKCGNCAKQEEERVKITSSEVLTPMLIDYIKIGDLRSLEPSDVKPFLVDRLRWRVSTVEGERKDPRELAESNGLVLNISHSLLEGPPDAESLTIEAHPDVIAQIIANASPIQGTGPW